MGSAGLFVVSATTWFATARSSVADAASFRVALTFFTIFAAVTTMLHSPFFGTT
jgi:hypothetical protein